MQAFGEPLQIDSVALSGNGLIGMCCCPGRLEFYSVGVRARDLDKDLTVITAWRPSAVISLIEEQELSLLGVPQLPERYKALPFDWHHCPITDLGAPGPRFEAVFGEIQPRLLERLRSGERILLHCAAGLGRAGTIAARLLVRLGEQPDRAIARVRTARPGAIESTGQETYLRSLKPGELPP